MKLTHFAAAIGAGMAFLGGTAAGQDDLDPRWEQLNARELPAWFDEAVFGVFIHWGVYAVPAWCDTSTYSEWYWYWVDTNAHNGKEKAFHEANYGADFKYEDFAPMFRAELFDPDEWADIFKRAGADYIVHTSKHHDGYCMWPSKEASASRGHAWNSMEVGPKRDIIGELTEAVRAHDIHMGLYYSFMEWHNPVFERDLGEYVDTVMWPQVQELITKYHPDVFWPDGEWNHPESAWKSADLLTWIYGNAPNRDMIVVNDRWGRGTRARTGDYWTTEYGGGGEGATSGEKPFEECRGIGHSFAFNRAEGYDIYLSREECVRTLIDLVSRGGKLLLDIGPTADGRIPLIMQDRLFAIGRWLDVNGESLRGADPSPFKHAPWGAATVKGTTLYLHLYDWPETNRLDVPGLVTDVDRAYLLSDATKNALPFERTAQAGFMIDLAGCHPFESVTTIALDLAGPVQVDNRIYPDGAGRFILTAAAADTHGPNVRLEQSGFVGPDESLRELALPAQNLGYWFSAEDGVSWSAAVEPGRTYEVGMVYACKTGAEGSRGVVRVGDASVPWTVDQPTGGGWHHYRLTSLGRATPTEGDIVTVRFESVKGEAAVNIRAVILTPID